VNKPQHDEKELQFKLPEDTMHGNNDGAIGAATSMDGERESFFVGGGNPVQRSRKQQSYYLSHIGWAG